MGNIHFYLKKAEKKTGQSLIFLQWKFNGYVLRFSFGQTVNPSDWNKKKERIKIKTATSKDGKYNLNDLLDGLEEACENIYNSHIKQGIPRPAVIKKDLQRFIAGEPDEAPKQNFHTVMDDFVNNNILNKGRKKSKYTVKTYKTVQNHLKDFEKKLSYKVSLETIRVEFASKYWNFLKAKGLSHNTITKHFKCIIAVMNRATLLGYTTNAEYKRSDFSMSYVDSDAVYLSNAEIEKLYSHDFSFNKRLEQTRDLFVFGCFVGLRFQDFTNIKPENIINDGTDTFLRVITNKTGEEVIIPCHYIVLQIFEKYKHHHNSLPRTLSNQKFNEYIKEVCKVVGLTEKRRLISEPDKELYKCISSHTCRRSFATNLYLQGFPAHDIMKITGHRTERAFKTYIKISKIDAARRLGHHMKVNWGNYGLKAVI